MGAKFEVYRDIAGGYRWRLKARNGEIVAISESYISKYGATRSAELVRSLAGTAMIVDITR